MSSTKTNRKAWARDTWKRAFEGALITPTCGKDGIIVSNTNNDGIFLSSLELDNDEETKTNSKGLLVLPRESVFQRLAALVLRLQDETTGIQTIQQNFKEICESGCQASGCVGTNCLNTDVPFAFRSSALLQWLMKDLETDFEDACQIATMICKTGFIYPCNTAWDITTLSVGNLDENVLYRFQSQYYWPTENQSASDTDYAGYLLLRDTSNIIPLEEYEKKCLSKLEQFLGQQWEFIKKSNAMKESLNQQCCITDQYITRWQEFAYWNINRPQTYHKYIGRSTTQKNIMTVRGLNRNFSSFITDKKQNKKEKDKKKAAKSPSKVLKASCNKIITACTEWGAIDPFMIDDPVFYNPWKEEETRGAWPSAANVESGPYRLQCVSWGLSFERLLRDPLGMWYFEQHLKKEFSEENLDFYNECVFLRSAPSSQVNETIQAIYNDFISPSASTPVNIDTQVANLVKQELKKTQKTRYAFDHPLEHIFKLMQKDSYKRFLKSNIYKDALAAAKDPSRMEKQKMRLPRIWRLSQFLPKPKLGDIERGGQ